MTKTIEKIDIDLNKERNLQVVIEKLNETIGVVNGFKQDEKSCCGFSNVCNNPACSYQNNKHRRLINDNKSD